MPALFQSRSAVRRDRIGIAGPNDSVKTLRNRRGRCLG
jgi:hypothetical protein